MEFKMKLNQKSIKLKIFFSFDSGRIYIWFYRHILLIKHIFIVNKGELKI